MKQRALVAAPFFALWFMLGVCSGLLMFDSIALLLLYVTLGLALVLFPLPTIFLYSTAWLAPLILWVARVPRFILILFGLGATAAIATVPGLLALPAASANLASWTDGDVAGDLPAAPRTLRILVPVHSVRADRQQAATVCDDACQTLLYNDEVDAIEVRSFDGAGGGASTVWRREAMPFCPSVFDNYDDALAETRRRMGGGDCLVPDRGATLPEAPWIGIERLDHKQRRKLNRTPILHELRDLRRVRAGRPQDTWDAPTMRRTEVEARMVSLPTLIAPIDMMQTSMSWGMWRITSTHNAFTLKSALQEAFGYRLDEVDAPKSDGLATLRPLLDRPGDAYLGPELQRLLDEVLAARRQHEQPLSDEELGILGDVLRDRRIPYSQQLPAMLRTDPDAAMALIPAMVDHVNEIPPDDRPHSQVAIAGILANQSFEHLQPHLEALWRAAAREGAWETGPLLAVLPQWVDDPGPVLARGLTATHAKRLTAALKGVCNAPTSVAEPMLDAIEAMWADQTETFRRAILIRTMQRHGREDVATRWFDALEQLDRRRVRTELDRLAATTPPGGCRP